MLAVSLLFSKIKYLRSCFKISTLLKALQSNNYTLLIEKEKKIIFNSKEKGIKSLYYLIQEQPNVLLNANVADTVVGKAAAMLYVKGEVNSVKTKLASESAIEYLESANIKINYIKKTPYISNRNQTGKCPLEKIAESSLNPEDLIEELGIFLK